LKELGELLGLLKGDFRIRFNLELATKIPLGVIKKVRIYVVDWIQACRF